MQLEKLFDTHTLTCRKLAENTETLLTLLNTKLQLATS